MADLINNPIIIKKAYDHLSNDPVLKYLIEKFGDKINPLDRYNSNYALSICNLIIEQQISFKAAISIKNKFSRKVEYMKNVLLFFRENEMKINHLSDKEIINKLISIKGVGIWTCEMFLMFVCLRKDIFSFGDLALVNSIKKNYSIDDFKIIKSITENWKPYRTIAALLLWYSIENKIFFK